MEINSHILSVIEDPSLFAEVGEISRVRLSKISLDEAYMKEWNEHMNDFVTMTINGKMIEPVLYRLGGLNFNIKVGFDRYFMLLRYTESRRSERIMKMCGSKAPKSDKYLKGVWCIFDKDGKLLHENGDDSIHSPYLVKNAPIFSLDGIYYHLLTKKRLGNSRSSIQTDNFIILDNQYEKDEEIKGVIKIDKKDGSFIKIT